MYQHIILNLTFVLVVIGIYLFINWRLKSVKVSKNKSLEILSILQLGSKEKIVIMRAESKKFLLGVTSNSVNFLYHLSDEEEKRQHDEVNSQGEFNRVLNDYIDRQLVSKDLQ